MAVLDCRMDHATGQPSPEKDTLGGLMMWYVYCRHLSSGREDFVGVYDTAKEAVHKIAQCYYIDAHSCQKDEYYYFMKKH